MRLVFLDAATMGNTSLEPIAALGEFQLYPTSTIMESRERVRDADVILTNKAPVDGDLMDCAPHLKMICVAATGVNHIDLEAARVRGIKVRNVAGYSTESVLQITWMHILTLLCRPSHFDREVKDFTYSRSGVANDVSSPFMELCGKKMGIIGMGTIGHRVAEVAVAMGMDVCYFSTSGTSHCADFPSVPLDSLMKECDVISVHAPLNDRTRGLVGERELSLMKPTAVIVNMGRGGIIDEAALAAAVDGARIAGAGLDVYSKEPLPEDNPLLHTAHPERFSFTPHLAWASNESLDRLVLRMADNIREIFVSL